MNEDSVDEGGQKGEMVNREEGNNIPVSIGVNSYIGLIVSNMDAINGVILDRNEDLPLPLSIFRERVMVIEMTRSDASSLVSDLRMVVRTFAWKDTFTTDTASKIHRAGRLMYELLEQLEQDLQVIRLANVTQEDADVLSWLPSKGISGFVRESVDIHYRNLRRFGPITPVESDNMARGLFDMMEG